MKNRILNKIVMGAIIILFIFMLMPDSIGTIKPTDITGLEEELEFDFVETLENFIRTAGIFLSVGAMMVIGIKYMTGSIEEKANYKKTMVPYVLGCFIIFGASTIVPEIIKTFRITTTTQVEDIGNLILSLIRVVGTVIAVGVLMLLGIKYMIGSMEEKASYKKTMLPYVIGAVMLFAAVNLTDAIYDIATQKGTIEENKGTIVKPGRPEKPGPADRQEEIY